MKHAQNTSELTEIIKKLMKERELTGHKLAMLLGKDPAYVSRVINNKHEISADIMFKILKHMGCEIVILTKKERNLLEQKAYAELSKNIGTFREEIRSGLINEIQQEIIKNISEYFISQKIDKKNK
jgi:transcriptional regulator with XRE-family HTH domain